MKHAVYMMASSRQIGMAAELVAQMIREIAPDGTITVKSMDVDKLTKALEAIASGAFSKETAQEIAIEALRGGK